MKQTLAKAALVFLAVLLVPAPAHARGWTWPVQGEVITPYRNGHDPYAAGQHRGIDIAAPVGERVVAAAAGTVTFAGGAGSSGLTVAVHTRAGGLDTSYLHLSRVAVAAGERVEAGDPIGSVGTSGRRSAERPHLHFGVREAGQRHSYLDPLDFLGGPPPQGDPREPAPQPAPAPAEPRPGPAAAPAEPRPARAPRAVPSPGPHALPVPRPIGHPLATARPAADPFARPAPAGPAQAPAHGRSRAPAPAQGPSRAPAAPGRAPAGPALTDPGPGGPGLGSPDPAAGLIAREASVPAVTPRAVPHGGGVDAGWLAACAGLLLASATLGRAATRGSRSGRPGRRAGGGRAAAPLSGAAGS